MDVEDVCSVVKKAIWLILMTLDVLSTQVVDVEDVGFVIHRVR